MAALNALAFLKPWAQCCDGGNRVQPLAELERGQGGLLEKEGEILWAGSTWESGAEPLQAPENAAGMSTPGMSALLPTSARVFAQGNLSTTFRGVWIPNKSALGVPQSLECVVCSIAMMAEPLEGERFPLSLGNP